MCANILHADVSGYYPGHSGYGAEGHAEDDGRTAFQRYIDRIIVGAGVYSSWLHQSRILFARRRAVAGCRIFWIIRSTWLGLTRIESKYLKISFIALLIWQHPGLCLGRSLAKYRTPHPHLITAHPDGRLEIFTHPHRELQLLPLP